MITLTIKHISGKVDTLNIHGSDPISKVFDNYSSLTGMPKAQMRVIFAGRPLEEDGATVNEVGLTDGSTIHVLPALRGGKPVIYFIPSHAQGRVRQAHSYLRVLRCLSTYSDQRGRVGQRAGRSTDRMECPRKSLWFASR